MSCHLHVHVLQEHVLSRTGTCFAEKAADHPFNGSGSSSPRHFGCKTLGDGQGVEKSLASLTPRFGDLQWQLQPLKQEGPEQVRRYGVLQGRGTARPVLRQC